MRLRGISFIVAGAGTFIFGLAATAQVGSYRLNLTPSEPLGVWRIEALHRAAKTGDLVFICPPLTAEFKEARRRGYLHHGLCPGGFAPLIKTVVALPGQRVAIADEVVIDRRSLPASAVRKKDSEGRRLIPALAGVVPPHHLFLHSSFASSYDSRYFGPVPASGLLGLARPILTVDP